MNSKPSKVPVVVRSEVQSKSNYRDYREELRFDFYYSCAYCTLTESEAGGIGFQIDHYHPQKHKPDLVNEYTNLMWSCAVCNRYKSDYTPNEADLSKGHVVLRPDEHDPREHLELQTYSLKSKTPTGEFNIQYLDLNRALLVRLRRLREKFWKANQYIAFGIHEVVQYSLDNLLPEKRPIFSRMRQSLKARRLELVETTVQLIREFAKSPLLDADPEKSERSAVRRKFLNEQRAIILGLLDDHSETE